MGDYNIIFEDVHNNIKHQLNNDKKLTFSTANLLEDSVSK